MTFNLLHFCLSVHLTSKVRDLVLLKHLLLLKERIHFFEKYLPHRAKDDELVVAGDVYHLDGLVDIVLHCEVVLIGAANDVLQRHLLPCRLRLWSVRHRTILIR